MALAASAGRRACSRGAGATGAGMAGEGPRPTGLRVARGGTVLLAAVDWVVRPVEKWAVLGPNGAGKTTLLQVAAARLFPTSGVVDLLDERLRRVRGLARPPGPRGAV